MMVVMMVLKWVVSKEMQKADWMVSMRVVQLVHPMADWMGNSMVE